LLNETFRLKITAQFYLAKPALASLASILLAIFLDILAVRGVSRERLSKLRALPA
jgi:hypothetical protein